VRIIFFSIIIFAIDQLTKFLVKQWIGLGDSIRIFGDYVRFTHIENKGIIFGIMTDNMLVFTILSVLAAFLVFYYLVKVKSQRFIYRFSLSVYFGGALGNIFDRVFFGKVVDFMDVNIPDVHIPPYQFITFRIPEIHMTRWPVFNVADVAIFLGMIMLLVAVFFTHEDFHEEGADKNKDKDVKEEA